MGQPNVVEPPSQRGELPLPPACGVGTRLLGTDSRSLQGVVADRSSRDLLVVVSVVAVGTWLFTRFDAAERLLYWVQPFEPFEIDDLLLALSLLLCAAIWFAGRRYRESRARLRALQAAARERQSHVHKLEELSAELLTAEAAERERLSYVLHDGVSQTLYAARLHLDALAVDDGVAALTRERLRAAGELVSDAMAQTRALSAELGPLVRECDTLVEGLQRVAARVQVRYGVQVLLRPSEDWLAVRPEWHGVVAQAVQELLINAGKHAAASTIEVEIQRLGTGILDIAVTDDGRGFVAREAIDEGLGLYSLKRRLGRIRGQVVVGAHVPRGTRVSLHVPAD